MDIAQFIIDFVSKYPIISSILMLMGVLRSINKPLFAFLHTFVQSTPSNKDDLLLEKVEQSKIYKGFSFVLDWFGSIKLKK